MVNPDWTFVQSSNSQSLVAYRFNPYDKVYFNGDAAKVLFAITDESPNADSLLLSQSVKGLAFQKKLLQKGIIVQGGLRQKLKCKRICTDPPLERLFIELTSKCNLRCMHCYGSFPSGQVGRDLDTRRIIDLVDEAADLGVYEADITGGEPLLASGLFPILECLSSKDIGINLFTNGFLLDRDIADRLAECHMRSIIISLDGLSKHSHDLFRGVPGSFDRARRAMDLVYETGIQLRVNVTVNRYNGDEVGPLVLGLKREYPRVKIVVCGILKADEKTDSFKLSYREEARIAATARGDDMRKRAADIIRMNIGHLTTPCGLGDSFLFINSAGSIGLCPTLTEREDPEFGFGNITTGTLAEAWMSLSKFSKVNAMQCQSILGCKYGKACRGGCRSRAYDLSGSLAGEDLYMCELYKCLLQ